MALRAELPILWMIGAVLLMTLLRFILGRIKAGRDRFQQLPREEIERPILEPGEAATDRPTETEVFPCPSEPPPGPGTIVDQLRNPGSLRDAVVLREVLGPPKALHPYEGRIV